MATSAAVLGIPAPTVAVVEIRREVPGKKNWSSIKKYAQTHQEASLLGQMFPALLG